MKKNTKRGVFLLGVTIITTLLFILFNKYYIDQPKLVRVSFEVKAEKVDQFKVYYDLSGNKEWNEKYVDTESYTKDGKFEKLTFSIPKETKNLRVDFGNSPTNIEVRKVAISGSEKIKVDRDYFEKLDYEKSNLQIMGGGESAIISSLNNDPYIILNNVSSILEGISGRPGYLTIVLIVLSLVLGLLTTNALKGVKSSINFIKESMSNKSLIMNLAKNDFKQKYASSYLGIVWGFIHPLITIVVYWFVFTVGLRSTDVGEIPFILWFVSGIIPWFFFSEALSACTNVFVEYSYLVKKVVFKIEALPIIKIISTLFVHGFFILFLIIISAFYKYYPDAYMLQFIYYSFAMICLVFTVSIFTSSVVLFFRDLSQIIAIIINVGFWATPIGWNIEMLPLFAQKIFKLNPMFYIVNGYRDSFAQKVFFWDRPYETLYFWCFCIIMLLLGVKIFNKLRPHFSDVI